MQFQQSFSDYYNTNDYVNKTENETISGNGNYYIHDAVFSYHYQKTAISLNSSSKVLLEMCAFYNNNSTEKGGSIFIKESNCVLVHICFSNSSSNEDGCAYYIKNSIFDPEKSYAIECSVSKCSGKQSAFVYWEGDIQISNMNTSYNIITTNAAYSISSITNTIILNFTTVSNCSSSEIGVVNVGPMTRNVTNCNYIEDSSLRNPKKSYAFECSVSKCIGRYPNK